MVYLWYFNPRPPCGGRPVVLLCQLNRAIISIHAPRAGGDEKTMSKEHIERISIHAPRAGGDGAITGTIALLIISIHAPRAGGDCWVSMSFAAWLLFQSTPPVRGATTAGSSEVLSFLYFNPRPPCGGRPAEEHHWTMQPIFQSTPPVRGATPCRSPPKEATNISIHAPRAGGDWRKRVDYF